MGCEKNIYNSIINGLIKKFYTFQLNYTTTNLLILIYIIDERNENLQIRVFTKRINLP